MSEWAGHLGRCACIFGTPYSSAFYYAVKREVYTLYLYSHTRQYTRILQQGESINQSVNLKQKTQVTKF
jgi:hypothetical protein